MRDSGANFALRTHAGRQTIHANATDQEGLTDSGTRHPSWQSRDWWVAGLLLLFAGILRFWNISSLGLTHFDEGSYAMAGRWFASLGAEGFAPQAGHSPPFYPLLVGAVYWVFGSSDGAAIAVSAVAGSLTVGLVYFLAQRFWGRDAAIVSSLLLATSEYHLIYSRMALTDALFTLLFWLSLGALLVAFREESSLAWLIGGVSAGLCWNTKYHGFLPLLIIGAWWLYSDWVRRRRPQSDWDFSDERRMSILGLQLASGLGLALFLPWVLIVSYRPGWGEILAGQWRQSLGISSGWPATSPATLWFFLTSWSAPLLVAALCGLIWAIWRRDGNALFVGAVCGVFCSALLFYTPFPRLLLPLIPGFSLLGGFALARGLGGRRILVGLAALVFVAGNLTGVPSLLQLRTDSYRQAARYLDDLEVTVFSQLSKNFYFYEKRKSIELRWILPEQLDHLWKRTDRAVMAIDPIVHKLPVYRAWVEKERQETEVLQRFRIDAYEVVYYQGFNPGPVIEQIPRRIAPFVPGESFIEIYRRR